MLWIYIWNWFLSIAASIQCNTSPMCIEGVQWHHSVVPPSWNTREYLKWKCRMLLLSNVSNAIECKYKGPLVDSGVWGCAVCIISHVSRTMCVESQISKYVPLVNRYCTCHWLWDGLCFPLCNACVSICIANYVHMYIALCAVSISFLNGYKEMC